MKLRLLLALALIVGGFLVVPENQASAVATVTPEVVERIRARCVENQGTLNRLQKTDAFLRNDRGNLYRTISDKLMVPLNRRLATNQLDGGALLSITSDYNDEYTKFYRTYIDYDNAMSATRKIDCTREPVAFYNSLMDVREKRITLSESNQKIKELVREYGVAFTDFKTTYEEEN